MADSVTDHTTLHNMALQDRDLDLYRELNQEISNVKLSGYRSGGLCLEFQCQ